MKIKTVICGFGFMGQTHCANIMQNENASIAAIVNTSGRENIKPISGNIKTSAIDWNALNNVPFFTSLADCIDNCDFDAAIIATPTAIHQAMASELLRHKKHIFLEKPLCATEAEARQLLEESAQTNCIFQAGHCLRFFPEYQYLSSVCSKKQYGKLKYLKLIRRTGVPVWGAWKNKDTSLKSITGPVFDLNIHDVDFVRYLLGEPDRIQSAAYRDKEGLIQQIISLYSYGTDIAVSLEAAWDYPAEFPFDANYRVKFAEATVLYKNNVLTVYPNSGAPFQPELAKFSGEHAAVQGNISDLGGYYNELRYFAEGLLGKNDLSAATLEDAVAAIKLAKREIEACGGLIVK
jgi:predicted dehydrogenase